MFKWFKKIFNKEELKLKEAEAIVKERKEEIENLVKIYNEKLINTYEWGIIAISSKRTDYILTRDFGHLIIPDTLAVIESYGCFTCIRCEINNTICAIKDELNRISDISGFVEFNPLKDKTLFGNKIIEFRTEICRNFIVTVNNKKTNKRRQYEKRKEIN